MKNRERGERDKTNRIKWSVGKGIIEVTKNDMMLEG